MSHRLYDLEWAKREFQSCYSRLTAAIFCEYSLDRKAWLVWLSVTINIMNHKMISFPQNILCAIIQSSVFLLKYIHFRLFILSSYLFDFRNNDTYDNMVQHSL